MDQCLRSHWRLRLNAKSSRRTKEEIATKVEQLASATPPGVLDVRLGKEHQEKRIEESFSLPLIHLRDRLHDIPRNRSLVVHCASGYRSAMAIGLLEQVGVTNVTDLVGGIAAWEATQLPIMDHPQAA